MMRGIWLENKILSMRADLAVPTPALGEALIRVLQAGICNTDLELLQGYYPYSGILGHEFVGIVESGPEHLLKQRVVGEITAACHQCQTCLRGHLSHCENRTTLGIVKRNGAFAEYLTLPVKNLHIVPQNIPTESATFTEPLAAALEIQQQVHVQPSDKVLVLGAGKLGLLIAQTLRLLGCDLVVGSRTQKNLALLQQLDLQAMSMNELAAKTHYFDIVVECTGNPEGFKYALQLVRPRGTLVLKSTYATSLTINAAPLVVNEINVIGSRCGPFAPALRLLAQQLVQVTPLIQAYYSLTEGIQAFNVARTAGALKILLKTTE